MEGWWSAAMKVISQLKKQAGFNLKKKKGRKFLPICWILYEICSKIWSKCKLRPSRQTRPFRVFNKEVFSDRFVYIFMHPK